jgi:hypothetical protein
MLRNVTFLLLQDFIEFVYIRTVLLQYSLLPLSSPPFNTTHSISLPATHPVEQCACPTPYQGLSCEACARGFARPSGDIGDNCTRSVAHRRCSRGRSGKLKRGGPAEFCSKGGGGGSNHLLRAICIGILSKRGGPDPLDPPSICPCVVYDTTPLAD